MYCCRCVCSDTPSLHGFIFTPASCRARTPGTPRRAWAARHQHQPHWPSACHTEGRPTATQLRGRMAYPGLVGRLPSRLAALAECAAAGCRSVLPDSTVVAGAEIATLGRPSSRFARRTLTPWRCRRCQPCPAGGVAARRVRAKRAGRRGAEWASGGGFRAPPAAPWPAAPGRVSAYNEMLFDLCAAGSDPAAPSGLGWPRPAPGGRAHSRSHTRRPNLA